MKNIRKVIFIINFLIVALISCTKDETDFVSENKVDIETVSFEEALNFFSTWNKQPYQTEDIKRVGTDGKLNNGFVVPDLEMIYQKELLNSKEFVTVIPHNYYQSLV